MTEQHDEFRAVARQMYADGRERFYQLVREQVPVVLMNDRLRASAWAILEAIGEVSPDEGIAALQREASALSDPRPPAPDVEGIRQTCSDYAFKATLLGSASPAGPGRNALLKFGEAFKQAADLVSSLSAQLVQAQQEIEKLKTDHARVDERTPTATGRATAPTEGR